MREIKFRAWDTYLKRYAFIGFAPIGEVTIFSGIEIYIKETNSAYKPLLERYFDFELEEFTGLKDRNGVEIYEGDIVISALNKPCPVIFENGCFCWYKEPLGYDLGEEDSDKIYLPEKWATVIGNVYQNSELLP